MKDHPEPDDFIKDAQEYRTTVSIDLTFKTIDEHVAEKHSELIYDLMDVLREYQGIVVQAETTAKETDEIVTGTNLDWAHSPDDGN